MGKEDLLEMFINLEEGYSLSADRDELNLCRKLKKWKQSL
ncbi:hypothetical protein YA5_022830 [Tetragenococcus halophilus]|nr:hypothetical protein YA5_022830 [Tetragenococcus halophilus]